MKKETSINYVEICIDLLDDLQISLADIEYHVKRRRSSNGWHTDDENHPSFPLDLKEMLGRQRNIQASIEFCQRFTGT